MLHGVDVDGEAIAWCEENLAGGQFTVSPVTPPLSFASEYFDAVYCISVFTHLDEAMQDKWLAELARILKPGGVLVFTIHGERAARTLDKGHFDALRSDGMLHLQSRKLAGLVPDWYNTSWHTQGYILERTSRWFCESNYYMVADGLQDFVAVRK
jgi:ubiquinone/menaquinone biosynthesis C-methylase UbiE